MRLVLTLLVRDEADVIAATIEHHFNAGVDHIIATDNGSVDGTREILAEYTATGRLTVIDEPDHTYEQAKWVTRMARLAAEEKADWVINADADEFFTPRDYPSLKTALSIIPDQYGQVQAARENLLGDPRLDSATPWPARLIVRDLLSLHERGGRIGGKIIHRGVANIDVAQGNHAIKSDEVGKMWPAAPITIYHVPDRSYAQFENKIRVGGASLAANETLAKSSGWHWRADYERLQAGTLHETWQSRQLSESELTEGINAGSLIYDVSLRERLIDVFATAVRPDLLAPVFTGNPSSVRGR